MDENGVLKEFVGCVNEILAETLVFGREFKNRELVEPVYAKESTEGERV